jgi:demethylmenaquinone methyltransferase / 2-methoxy-6-polyprenyl-1,4-benzoquinol methylase
MFNGVARLYDPLNTIMTAGLHHRWRSRGAELAGVGPGDDVLDVATGTGDLACELARRVAPGGTLIGLDFSERMLERARRKAVARGHATEAHFTAGDALALPYAPGTFDAVTIGFGARNFADLHLGLSEAARVLRPGGKLVVLEFTRPTRRPWRDFYGIWLDRFIPLLGRLVARRPDAYSYLPASIRRFPAPIGLARELDRCGLVAVRWITTAGGLVTMHVGEKRGDLGDVDVSAIR